MRETVPIKFRGTEYRVICDFAFIQRCENAGANLMELGLLGSQKRVPKTTDIVAVIHAALEPHGIKVEDVQEYVMDVVRFWEMVRYVPDLVQTTYRVDPETLPDVGEKEVKKEGVKKKARSMNTTK